MTISTAIPSRFAILVGTKEVTFTPYVIRKVGEVREVTIDGVVQNVIYNERRNLTYLVLNEVTGRIADELKAGQEYGSFKKGTKAAPKAAPAQAAPKAAPAPLVDPAAKAVAAAAKVRRAPKVAPAQAAA
jgi:hypothetical protein